MNKDIQRIITSSIEVKRQLLTNEKILSLIEKVSDICTIAFKADKKLLFCGNGGSSADAQHIAGEFTGRFYLDRPPLHAEALHVNGAYMTAVCNDYSFEEVYARQVQAKGRTGDVFFGISTSGNSANVVKAMQQARQQQMMTVAMTGATGGKLAAHADFLLNIPSIDTPRIQEAHIMVGHIICELVEKNIFG